MKTVRFYDVQCEECGKFASSDFFLGFSYTRDEAIANARSVGFRETRGKTVCPYCYSELSSRKKG